MSAEVGDVFRSMFGTHAGYTLAALAAAAAEHGTVTAEVEVPEHCPRCGSEAWQECHGVAVSTVRVVVHLADPALANRLRMMAAQGIAVDDLHAAARIVGGDL